MTEHPKQRRLLLYAEKGHKDRFMGLGGNRDYVCNAGNETDHDTLEPIQGQTHPSNKVLHFIIPWILPDFHPLSCLFFIFPNHLMQGIQRIAQTTQLIDQTRCNCFLAIQNCAHICGKFSGFHHKMFEFRF